MDVSLSPLAELDLREIWRHSAGRWSAKQADRYVDSLFDAIELIAANPKLGTAVDFIRRDYRRHTTLSHVIYYRLNADIEIVRILHKSRDIDGQFPDNDE